MVDLTLHTVASVKLGSDLGVGDVVAAVDLHVPCALGVAERANVFVFAGVDLVDELLHDADVAEPALDQITEEVSAGDAVLFTKLATAADERTPTAVVPGADAAQAAVLVEGHSHGTRVHARSTVPALAETQSAAVAATVEEAEVPALLAAEKRVLVSVSGTALHPVAHN